MTKIHEGAQAWEKSISARFGEAVMKRRKALGLSATQLWEKTVQLGYPVTRVAISKIENNTRNGKLDIGEILGLAWALDIPPALLLFPDYPDGTVDIVPGVSGGGASAVRWISGQSTLPAIIDGDRIEIREPNPGIDLVEAVTEQQELRARETYIFLESKMAERKGDQDAIARSKRMVEDYLTQMAQIDRRIELAKSQLWGSDA